MMKLPEIKEIAKSKGLKAVNMKKEELIKAIQRAEGNHDCFRTLQTKDCGRMDCLWREDCLTI